jgi:predicted transcriptional regulator
MTRETVNQAISSLPQNFDLDALVERLIFIEKVEVGLAQLDRGESKTQEEVEQLVKSWRK